MWFLFILNNNSIYLLYYDGYKCDGIYTIFNFNKLNKLVKTVDTSKYINDNNITESFDLNSFKIQSSLNPKIWKNNRLDSRVRLKLLDIADDFTDFLNVDWVKPDDIIITGSIANYNWSTKYSDIDLHIVFDFEKIDKRVDFVKNYFDAKKNVWNNEHKNIKIFDFNVEVYVQDKNEKHTSSGIYSLEKNKWIVEPEKMSDLKKSDLKKSEQKAEKWSIKIDNILNKYKSNSTETQKEEVINNVDNVIKKLKDFRKNGFDSKKEEMNPNNIVFKMLRRNGDIEKLYNKKREIYDDLMSINEESFGSVVNENESNNTSNKLYHQTTNDINVIKSIIKNGLIPQDKNGEGKGIWFSEEPFYDVRTTTFSIPNNEETLRKYNFNSTFDGDIKIARKCIPFNDFTVENIPFAIINDNTYLFSSSKKFLMSMANKKGYDNIAEYLSNNKNFKSIVIFKDLFEKFVESGTFHIFNNYPNIKIINLFD